jgi:hypothetical protein
VSGLLHYTSYEPDELGSSSAQQIERYLVGRGGGKRHTIAGAPQPGAGPDSPRRRRTGLMTVMEKSPDIPPDILQVSFGIFFFFFFFHSESFDPYMMKSVVKHTCNGKIYCIYSLWKLVAYQYQFAQNDD